MANCPFAEQKPISGGCGTYTGGDFKIVHHTTEGSTAAGAFDNFKLKKADPHFTVDALKVYQHIDTNVAARALRHPPGGIQTNRERAVQIEVVGFAGANKNPLTLKNVARLCRWIEATHGVARSWPAGTPKPPHNGGDPGGHNRDAAIWTDKSGHFGHCHVPDNVHWDPAYTPVEADYVLAAEFNEHGELINHDHPKVQALQNRPMTGDGAPAQAISDHDDDAGEPEECD
jgi:hypothetical protein